MQEDISILEKSSNPEDVAVVKRLRFLLENKDEKITTRDFLRIGRALRRNGLEPVERMGEQSYNLSDDYAWKIDKKVMEYANKTDRLPDAAKYVTSGDYDVSVGEHIKDDGSRGSEFVANKGDNGKMFLDTKDFEKGADFNAEKFYYTAWHEGHHKDMLMSAWKSEGGVGSLGNWADAINESDWANHTAAQEYINTDPARIKYYDQMSQSTKDFIKPLTEKAKNGGYRRMLKYYESLGY